MPARPMAVLCVLLQGTERPCRLPRSNAPCLFWSSLPSDLSYKCTTRICKDVRSNHKYWYIVHSMAPLSRLTVVDPNQSATKETVQQAKLRASLKVEKEAIEMMGKRLQRWRMRKLGMITCFVPP